jgi:pyridoxal 5'-phosphate synthase pdxT subunit
VEVGILALQGDVAEHADALADLGVAARLVRRPDDLRGLDGIILPGGESTTMSMLVDSAELRDPLAKELDSGLPVFGTCAGMILLATEVIGGRQDQRSFGLVDMSVRRNGFGRQLDSFECDLEVAHVEGGPVHAVFIRAPFVERVGEGVEVLAAVMANDDVTGMTTVPVLCRQATTLVAAFHPELTPDRRLHELFLSTIHERGR